MAKWFAYSVGIIVAGLMFLVYLSLLGWGTPEIGMKEADKYEILSDLLPTIYFVIGLLVAIFTAAGIGLYHILKHLTQEAALKKVDEETKEWREKLAARVRTTQDRLAMLQLFLSYQRWYEWSKNVSDDRKDYLLDWAIDGARGMLGEGKMLTEDQLLWGAKNNAAWFLVEKHRVSRLNKSDIQLAQRLAKELYEECTNEKSAYFNDVDFLHTCACVFRRLPVNEEDLQQSRVIVDKLRQREDVNQTAKEKLLAEYEEF